jgi:hypothetical protein
MATWRSESQRSIADRHSGGSRIGSASRLVLELRSSGSDGREPSTRHQRTHRRNMHCLQAGSSPASCRAILSGRHRPHVPISRAHETVLARAICATRPVLVLSAEKRHGWSLGPCVARRRLVVPGVDGRVHGVDDAVDFGVVAGAAGGDIEPHEPCDEEVGALVDDLVGPPGPGDKLQHVFS